MQKRNIEIFRFPGFFHFSKALSLTLLHTLVYRSFKKGTPENQAASLSFPPLFHDVSWQYLIPHQFGDTPTYRFVSCQFYHMIFLCTRWLFKAKTLPIKNLTIEDAYAPFPPLGHRNLDEIP